MNILILTFEKQRFKDCCLFAELLEIENPSYQIYFSDNIFVATPWRNARQSMGFQPKKRKQFLFLKSNSIYLFLKEYYWIWKIKKLTFYGKKLLERHFIEVVFSMNDRTISEEIGINVAAKRLQVPVIVPSLVNFADYQRLKRSSLLYSSKSRGLYDFFFRKEFLCYEKEGFYYYPLEIMRALKKCNALFFSPWFIGGGAADIVTVGSVEERKNLILQGIDNDKVRLIGHPKLDLLYRHFTSMKRNEGSVDTRIVLSLPQFYEHGFLPRDKHFQMIDSLVSRLAKMPIELILILHPKMQVSDYIYLENKFSCRIENKEPLKAIAEASIYVATYSSTISWAILCGKPCVILDFVNLNYQMYDFLTNCQNAHNLDELESKIATLFASHQDFDHDWEFLSRDEVFSGQNMKNYVSLIEELTSRED